MKTHFLIRPLVLATLVMCFSSNCFAWGAKGHRIIGALAQQHLTASAQSAINDILEGDDLATASTWADEMRSSQDNVEFWSKRSAPWHYVNVPQGQDYASSDKNPLGDAFMAIETFSAILLDEDVPAGPVRDGLEFYFGDLKAKDKEVKAFALRFLVHVLGDLQQPLHMGYASDQGGNRVQLSWFGDATNLHTLWDTLLIENAGLSYTEYAQRLSNRISRTPASDVRGLERSDPDVWAKESERMLERIYAEHSASTELGYEYVAKFVPTVESQLVKGGLRTAYFLNSLFGGWNVGSP